MSTKIAKLCGGGVLFTSKKKQYPLLLKEISKEGGAVE